MSFDFNKARKESCVKQKEKFTVDYVDFLRKFGNSVDPYIESLCESVYGDIVKDKKDFKVKGRYNIFDTSFNSDYMDCPDNEQFNKFLSDENRINCGLREYDIDMPNLQDKKCEMVASQIERFFDDKLVNFRISIDEDCLCKINIEPTE